MRQTFDETTDRSFGPRHVPLIREAMARQGLDGFLVPHEDEHQNEYLPAANDRLAWATGFTGSAGAAVILKGAAAATGGAGRPPRRRVFGRGLQRQARPDRRDPRPRRR